MRAGTIIFQEIISVILQTELPIAASQTSDPANGVVLGQQKTQL